MKTLLILVDGMRPDALAGVPRAQEFLRRSTYTLKGRTVMPSITLPCHMSLFQAVPPERHGITTNTFHPQAKPVRGLCEVLSAAGKSCGFFYNWAELRDLVRPGCLDWSCYSNAERMDGDASDEFVTEEAIRVIQAHGPDFVFLYLGNLDLIGHDIGWMSEPYLRGVERAWEKIGRVTEILPADYDVIVTADHGGHDRDHGLDIPEDMTIPIIFHGPDFAPGVELPGGSIMDIAPTVAALQGVAPDPKWAG